MLRILARLNQSWRSPLAGLMLAALLGWPGLTAPQGFPPVEEGTPLLVVEAYSTTPNPVRSGQAFGLSVTVKNTGTKHADDIYAAVGGGSSFVGLSSPVLVGKLDPGFSASFELQVQAPSGLASGAATLPLSLLYRVGESGGIEVVRTVGIAVAGSGTVTGQPQIVIEQVALASEPLALGDRFDLVLSVRNVGTRAANGVTASLTLNEYLSPAQGSGTTQVGNLAPGGAVTVTLPLVVDQVSPTGRVLQTVHLEYADVDAHRFTSDETVGIDLGVEARKRPQLILTAVDTEPTRAAPGETFVLTLWVQNVGAGDARRLILRLGNEAALPPFAPVGASNVQYVPTVASGETVTLTQTLLVDGTAAGGAYRLGVELSYENAANEVQTETEVISLLVAARPYFRVGLFEAMPGPLVAGESFEIPVEVVNIGRQTVNVSTVEVHSDDMTLSEASLYLGPLDAGTSGSLVPLAVAAQPGRAQATVTVHYLDDFNTEQVLTQTLSFDIVAAEAELDEVAPDAAPSWLDRLWQAIRGLFGVGS